MHTFYLKVLVFLNKSLLMVCICNKNKRRQESEVIRSWGIDRGEGCARAEVRKKCLQRTEGKDRMLAMQVALLASLLAEQRPV